MRKLWFLLLAVCLIGFLAGCDGGGGGGSDDNGGNGGNGGGNGGDNGILTYVTSGLLDSSDVTGYSINNGVMTYTVVSTGDDWEQYSQLNVDTKNKTFELYEREKLNGALLVDQTFYGTWTGDGTTSITAHCTHYIKTGESTENPQDWDTVFAIDGNTTYWTSGEPFNWIWTLPQ